MHVDAPGSTKVPEAAETASNDKSPADDPAAGSTGFVDSLRHFADNVFASVHDRIELFAIELQEEKQRLIRTMVWAAAAVFAAALALAFVSLAVVASTWHTPARLPVVWGLAALHVAAAIWTGVRARALLCNQPAPFADSLDELKGDRECLRKDD